MSRKIELVFVPSMGLSHIIPTIEFAKRLIKLDNRISATFLIIASPHTPQSYLDSVPNSDTSIRFISLPPADLPPPGTVPGMSYSLIYIQNHIPHVKSFISQLISDSDSVRLIVDMFSPAMIDVAKELNIPSYLYFTSNAAVLRFTLYLPTLDPELPDDWSAELTLPSYVYPVAVPALPSVMLDKETGAYDWTVYLGKKFCETNGIIVNSVAELEPRPVDVFDQMVGNAPRVYMVGPVLYLEKKAHGQAQYDRIMNWLGDQPVSSVVFLCFGSKGSLNGVVTDSCGHSVAHQRPSQNDQVITKIPRKFCRKSS